MKIWILTILLLTVNASAATYYIDFASGSDANTPTQAQSKSTPWKHHPYMTKSSISGYSHTAGDQFIFKGGVTWDSSCFPWAVTGSGTSANLDYYGVDKSWYAGSSWTRPVFDKAYVNDANSVLVVSGCNYVTFDNLEIKRLNTTISMGAGLVTDNGNGGNYVTVKNCYIHGWRTSSSSDDAHGGVILRTYNCSTTFVLDNTEVENSENIGVQMNGVCCRCVAVIQNGSKIHDNSSGVLFCLDFNGSYLYNITGTGYDSAYHYNGIYLDPVSMGQKQGYIRNSRLHDVAGGANMAYTNVRGGATITMYNNVLYGTMSAQLAVEIEPFQYSGEGVGNLIAYNNTIYNYNSSSTAFHVVTRSGQPVGVLKLYNNHLINAASLTDSSAANTTTYSNGKNLLQTSAAATAQGYVLGNLYAPINLIGSTVGAGTPDTTTGNTTDILGVSRASAPAWDIGAYQFTSSIVSAPHNATVIISAL